MNFVLSRMSMLASLGPVGFLPASGTIASVLWLLPTALLMCHCSMSMYHAIAAVFSILSMVIIDITIKSNSSLETDPSWIVLDECVGMMIACSWMPLTLTNIIAAFIFFRLFDISKIGISYFESLPGALGIVADDIAAGLLANMCTLLFVRVLS